MYFALLDSQVYYISHICIVLPYGFFLKRYCVCIRNEDRMVLSHNYLLPVKENFWFVHIISVSVDALITTYNCRFVSIEGLGVMDFMSIKTYS